MVEGEGGAVQGEGHQSSGHHITPQLDDITLLIYNRESKKINCNTLFVWFSNTSSLPDTKQSEKYLKLLIFFAPLTFGKSLFW